MTTNHVCIGSIPISNCKEYSVNSAEELRLPDSLKVNYRMADYEKIRRPTKRSPTDQAPGAERFYLQLKVKR